MRTTIGEDYNSSPDWHSFGKLAISVWTLINRGAKAVVVCLIQRINVLFF